MIWYSVCDVFGVFVFCFVFLMLFVSLGWFDGCVVRVFCFVVSCTVVYIFCWWG